MSYNLIMGMEGTSNFDDQNIVEQATVDKERRKPGFLINIQLFAGDDKTEKPTSKRRSEAREKGQVLQSKDITSAILLLVAFYGLKYSGSFMYQNMEGFLKKVFTEYMAKDDLLAGANLSLLMTEILLLVIKTIAPMLGVIMAAGLIANFMQVGFLFTTKTLQPKFDKLNPLEGFKRLFSANAVMELAKSIAKITIIGYVAYSYIRGESKNILTLLDMNPAQIVSYIANLAVTVAIRMGMALVFIGIIDYIFQWRQHEKSLMMTKQEIKEEYKQTVGNPEIKGKIKEKQRQISMRRMMSDIPKADVVITNPTHFAVAIKYDPTVSDAPTVIAKGQDYLALRIKEIAKQNKIEIVENKPLARSLFSTTEIGERIPEDLFQAVAEVLAFVYGLKNKAI